MKLEYGSECIHLTAGFLQFLIRITYIYFRWGLHNCLFALFIFDTLLFTLFSRYTHIYIQIFGEGSLRIPVTCGIRGRAFN